MARLYAEQIKSRRDAALADLAQAKRRPRHQERADRQGAAALQRSEALAADLAAQRTERRRNSKRRSATSTGRRNSRARVGTQNALDQTEDAIRHPEGRARFGRGTDRIQSCRGGRPPSRHRAGRGRTEFGRGDHPAAGGEAAGHRNRSRAHRHRSPVDGVVVKRDIELGQTVAASLSAPTLFTIAQDLREIDIYANIDEADVGRIKPDQKRQLYCQRLSRTAVSQGSVRMVRLSAQTVQNVVTYTAVIGVKNEDLALLPGMTANLQIVTDERTDVLRIPNAALRFRPPSPRREQASQRQRHQDAIARPRRAEQDARPRVASTARCRTAIRVRSCIQIGVTDGSLHRNRRRRSAAKARRSLSATRLAPVPRGRRANAYGHATPRRRACSEERHDGADRNTRS